MVIRQVQNQSLMSCTHNVSKGSLGLTQKISLSGTVGIIDLNAHGLFLLKEVLSTDFSVPVGVEGISLLLCLADEFHFSVEAGL